MEKTVGRIKINIDGCFLCWLRDFWIKNGFISTRTESKEIYEEIIEIVSEAIKEEQKAKISLEIDFNKLRLKADICADEDDLKFDEFVKDIYLKMASMVGKYMRPENFDPKPFVKTDMGWEKRYDLYIC